MQLLNQWKSVLLLHLASFGSSCLEKKTLDKDFIGSILVSGPNISVCRYSKTSWVSNAHSLTEKKKESNFRENS